MVTVYLKTQPPVVVKDGTHVQRRDFQIWVLPEGGMSLPVAEFNTCDLTGYVIERGNDSKTD